MSRIKKLLTSLLVGIATMFMVSSASAGVVQLCTWSLTGPGVVASGDCAMSGSDVIGFGGVFNGNAVQGLEPPDPFLPSTNNTGSFSDPTTLGGISFATDSGAGGTNVWVVKSFGLEDFLFSFSGAVPGADVGLPVDFTISLPNTGGGGGQVPEPSTSSLAFAGLGLIGASIFRRRQQLKPAT